MSGYSALRESEKRPPGIFVARIGKRTICNFLNQSNGITAFSTSKALEKICSGIKRKACGRTVVASVAHGLISIPRDFASSTIGKGLRSCYSFFVDHLFNIFM